MNSIINCIKEKTCFDHIFKWASVITMIICWVIVVHVFSIQIDEPDVIMAEMPYKVDKQEVRGGDIINVNQKFCKTRAISGDFRAYFKDGVYFLFNQFETTEELGCQDIWVNYQVPTTLPSGKYQILYVITYKVSPFKTVQERLETEYFNVIND